MTPQRLRYHRGEKHPETIYVGPGSPWANPFQPSRAELKNNTGTFICETPDTWFEADPMDTAHLPARSIIRRPTPMESLILFTEYLGAGTNHRRGPQMAHAVPTIQKELRGKNLACWHELDEPCHADLLLDLANLT